VAALTLTGTASAKDICIQIAGQPAHVDCQPADDDAATLDAAVTNANSSAGADRILISPGTLPYDGTTPTSTEDLVIDGSGRDATFAEVDVNNGALVSLDDPDSVVSDLEVRLLAPGFHRGLVVNGGGLVERVDVTGSSGGARAIDGANGFDVTDVMIDLSTSSAVGIQIGGGSGETVLTDVLARAATTVNMFGPPAVVITRGQFIGSQNVINGFNALDLRGDSFVVRSIGNGRAILIQNSQAGPAAIVVRHATLWARGNAATVDVFQQNGGSTTFDLESSAVVGPASPTLRGLAQGAGSTITFDPDYSSFRPPGAAGEIEQTGGVVTFNPGTGNLDGSASPRFVDSLRGDFRIRGNSPFVDAGEPTDVIAGASPLDYLGGTRVLDGNGDGDARRDIGAEEFDPANPPPPPPTPPSGDGGGDGDGAPPPPPPPPAPPTTPPVVLPPPPLARLSLAADSTRLDRRGRARLVVGCPRTAPGPCAGALLLRTVGRVRVGKRRQVLTLGRATFTLRAGRRATVRVRVGRRARRALRRAGRLRVRAVASARNASSATATFTLRPARRRR
jgi:hypothetical protein